MSADKTDKHQFYGKLDYHYQSVIVPPYVEHIMLVSYTVNTAEYLFHLTSSLKKYQFCNTLINNIL